MIFLWFAGGSGSLLPFLEFRLLWIHPAVPAFSQFGISKPKGPGHTKNTTRSKFTMRSDLLHVVIRYHDDPCTNAIAHNIF